MKRGYRTEKDILGSVKVPISAYYGIQTARAAKNFPISNQQIHPQLRNALAHVKMATASANADAKRLDKKIAHAIVRAGREVLLGKYDDQFIVNVYQAGAGTPWHMNMNEVLANAALVKLGKKKGNYKVIDPHNHVNMGQSTNNVIPTSIRIASIRLTDVLLLELKNLASALHAKGRAFRFYIKSGRTHLQDAVPISLGCEFDAWANTVEKHMHTINEARKDLHQISIGGTAVGTGINSFPKFTALTIKYLKKQTGLKLTSTHDKVQATQFMTDFVELSASLRNLAVDLTKITNDIRLLNSGPKTGFNELQLPQVEPGSSIMPDKFNPSMAEMLNMVCYQVMGNDVVVRESSASGQLELNTMTPIIAHNLLQSLDILRNGIREFTNRCVKGIKADKKLLQHYYESTPASGTVLNTIVGYDEAAKLIRESLQKNISIKKLAVQKKILTQKEADKLFSPKNLL